MKSNHPSANKNKTAHIMEVFLKNITQSLPQFIFWKDTHSVYLGCNQNYANLVGLCSPDDIVGKTDADLDWDHSCWYSFKKFRLSSFFSRKQFKLLLLWFPYQEKDKPLNFGFFLYLNFSRSNFTRKPISIHPNPITDLFNG